LPSTTGREPCTNPFSIDVLSETCCGLLKVTALLSADWSMIRDSPDRNCV
jgi:hypothetical protein